MSAVALVGEDSQVGFDADGWTNSEYVELIATAMCVVNAQAECTMDEAMRMLIDRALVSGRTLEYVATATVAGEIRFCE